MITVVSTKGQIVVPAEFRKADSIRPGQQFSMERVDDGVYLLKKIASPPNEGFVEWLQSCPESDWFHSIPSESTDSL